ncbi:MAG: hypothetical protein KFH87_13745 [Bacteroidetes bacterium]|nr:hypothetical protein [Bacteroidota bacterium]
MNIRILPLLLFPFFLTIACSDDDPAGTPQARSLYYVIQSADGEDGLYRYDIDADRQHLQTTETVTWLSQVAKNGIVIYETANGSTRNLWGRCEGGEILPVPMPVAEDPSNEFIYGREKAALSHEGHHLAFTAWHRPLGATDSTLWKLYLCVFDCGVWKMDKTEIGSVVEDYYADSASFAPTHLIPLWMGISTDGSTVAMEMFVLDRQADGTQHHRHLMLGGTLDQFHILTDLPVHTSPRYLFDPVTAEILFSDGRIFDCRDGSERFGTDMGSPGARIGNWETERILTAGSREVALSAGLYGATQLFRPLDGRVHEVPTLGEDLRVQYPELRFSSTNVWRRLSPDGTWLAVSVPRDEDQMLFVIRRDGTDLRLVTTGNFELPFVVSDVAPY